MESIKKKRQQPFNFVLLTFVHIKRATYNTKNCHYILLMKLLQGKKKAGKNCGFRILVSHSGNTRLNHDNVSDHSEAKLNTQSHTLWQML